MNRKNSTLGDQPIEPEFAQKMNVLAQTLDDFFNGDKKGYDRTTGFILMIFPFGAPDDGTHRTNYISNARRKDVIKLLEDQLKRFKKLERNPQE